MVLNWNGILELQRHDTGCFCDCGWLVSYLIITVWAQSLLSNYDNRTISNVLVSPWQSLSSSACSLFIDNLWLFLAPLKDMQTPVLLNVFIMSILHHSKTYHFLPPPQQATGLKKDMGRKDLHHCQWKAHIHCSSEFLPCFPMMIRLILFDYPQVSKTVTATVILGMSCFLLLKHVQVFKQLF